MAASSSRSEHAGAASEDEIRGRISRLTDRLGREVVVLAGENKGAVTMAGQQLQEIADTHGALRNDNAAMAAFANGNYQAVNNSVVLGGRCTVEDPGIHIAICDKGDEGDDEEEEEDENDDEREGEGDWRDHIE